MPRSSSPRAARPASAKRQRNTAPAKEVPPSAPAGEPAAEFPLSHLHSDILTVVLSRVPFSHRFWVVSRVCKRWRTAVLRSVTVLKLVFMRDVTTTRLRQPLSLFPNLTDITLRCPADDLSVHSLPTTLQRLRLKLPPFVVSSPYNGCFKFDPSFRLPVLSHITLHYWQINTETLLPPFVTDVISSLSLRLHGMATCRALAQLHFPNLMAFVLEGDLSLIHAQNASTVLTPFIARHAAKLSSLTLPVWIRITASWAQEDYPVLQSADLSCCDIDVYNLDKLVQRCPRLVRLAIPALIFHEEWLPASLPPRVTLLDSRGALLKLPRRLPSLREVRNLPVKAALQAKCAPHIIKLTLSSDADDLPTIMRNATAFSNLTFLDLGTLTSQVFSAMLEVRTSRTFAQLRTLRCRTVFPEEISCIPLLYQATRAAPRLRKLEIVFHGHPKVDLLPVAQIVELVAQKRHIEFVRITSSIPDVRFPGLAELQKSCPAHLVLRSMH